MFSRKLTTRREAMNTLAAGGVALSGVGLMSAGLVRPALAQSADSVSMVDLMAAGALPDVWQGKADAPVTIIEYASMTCSHCAAFHKDVWPAVKAKYVDTGKAKFVLREFPLDRLALAVLSHAFDESEKVDDKGKKEIITVMRIHPRIAPVKVGVFPLVKNKPEIVAKAREVYDLLKKHMNCFWDETASIGRRYARQDEAGTPFGVTIDFDTLGEKGPELLDTVTVRERDSQKQERIAIKDLLPHLLAKVG